MLSFKTIASLGLLTLVTQLVVAQGGCGGGSSLDRAGTGGLNGGSMMGGSVGSGGHLGTGGGGIGGCSDWHAGQGGTECGAPVVTAVDGDTGVAICDPTFTVLPIDGGVVCPPTGDPFELNAVDGAATCSFALQSLDGIGTQVDVQVGAPGYESGAVSIVPCPQGRDVKYVVPLLRTRDGGQRPVEDSGAKSAP